MHNSSEIQCLWDSTLPRRLFFCTDVEMETGGADITVVAIKPSFEAEAFRKADRSHRLIPVLIKQVVD